MTEDKLLTLAQAARLLGVQKQAMLRAVHRGTLLASKRPQIGGHYMYVVHPEEVERYRREHLGRVGQPRKSD